MVSVFRPVVWLAALAFVAGGCAGATEPSSAGIELSGSIYMDAIVDAPCDQEVAPPELTGVTLAFSDPSGRPIGSAVTAAPLSMELPKGPGTETWAHGGCRLFAPYTVRLPAVDAYTVAFTPREIERPINAGYFDGVNQLERQTITATDLAAAGYVWNFPVLNAYVVP